MQIETFQVGQLAANCYLVWDETTKDAVIIDPGDDGDFLSEQVLARSLNLRHILLTHGHFDHVLGILALKLNFNPIILLHKADESIYNKTPHSAKHWIGISADPPPPIDKYLREGEGVAVGGEDLIVVETPGHTPGSVCLYGKNAGIIFTGDLLFKDGVGRTDFSYSNHQDLLDSIQNIKSRFAGYRGYSGHGEVFTI